MLPCVSLEYDSFPSWSYTPCSHDDGVAPQNELLQQCVDSSRYRPESLGIVSKSHYGGVVALTPSEECQGNQSSIL